MAALDELIGDSPPMIELRRTVDNILRKVAGLRELPPILIQGETGTGKTTLARLIHRSSARAGGPFVDVNCAGFTESLLESELFGHERHAFTGAGPGRGGLFQAAHRGVLLLDEIGEMPLALQAKLLKVLDDGAREVRRVGATKGEVVDVAVIVATHADLSARVEAGLFRRDLYNRLAGIILEVPPLRARGGDVELLAKRFLQRFCQEFGVAPRTLADDALAALRVGRWPGNVRELANEMRRLVFHDESNDLTVAAADLKLSSGSRGGSPSAGADAREQLLEVLTRTHWNISRTAQILDISRNTVKARIDRFGLQSPWRDTPASAVNDGEPTTAPAPAARVPPVASPRPEPAAPVRPAPIAAEEVPATPAPRVRWARRGLSLLRVRVRTEGPTSLAVTTRALAAVVEHVQSFGGRVESMSAQSLVAVFGLDPDEDAPRRAAHAGLAIVKGIERPAGLSVAVGLHIMPMLVADVGGTVTLDEDGKAEAWRKLDELTRTSSTGVALSDAAAQFLGRRFETAPRAEHEHVAVWLVGPVPRELTSAPSAFVGRQRELSLLEGLLERVGEGQGQVVTIVGQAGIGKSRLVHEFVQTLPPGAVTALRGRCLSYGAHAPYHVALDVLRDACAIEDTDTSDAIEAKVLALLERLGAMGTAWAPYVVNLLCPGRDPALTAAAPERVRERTFEALQQLVIVQQERTPLVLVIEDLHWIDETSHELLAALAEAVVRRRILLLCTSRPGLSLPWAGRSHASQIALMPLSAEVSRRLVHSALGGDAVTDDLVDAILDRGEGNPFFLEELVRVLRGGDAMTRATIPETVEAVLSARIQRLPDEERQILQLAAVIGRDVPLALLEVVSDPPEERTRACVARLQAAEFLYPLRVGADAAYTFSHALTWDVAYQLVLEDERRALHARVVAGIEDRYGSRLNDHLERLAEHAAQGALWERAIEYSRQAGHKALAHSAYREAVEYFTRALSALEQAPATPLSLPLAIDLRLDLRTALVASGDFGRILELMGELQTLTEELGDARRQGVVAALLTGLNQTLGQSLEAVRHGARAREIGAAIGDSTIQVVADCWSSSAYFFLGDIPRSMELARRVIELIPRERSHETFGVAIRPAVMARGFLSWSLSELGRFAEAEAAALEALDIAEGIGDPSTVSTGLLALGTFRVRRGEIEQSLAPFQRANDLCQRHGFIFWRPTVASFLGYSLALLGRFGEGEAMLRAAIDQAASMRMNIFYTQATLWLGEARLLSGAILEADELARTALEVTRERQQAGLEGWALRLVAEVSTYREPLDVPLTERLYREALQRAEACGLRPLSARCCLGLGVLYRRAGKLQEAQAQLGAAAALFHEMQMGLWSQSAKAELRRLAAGDLT